LCKFNINCFLFNFFYIFAILLKVLTMKNFLRLIVLTFTSLVMFTSNGNAQTVLIDPAGAGGFELGADMAANGWTAVNAATDGWFVGNAPVVATGNNCGFVSSTGGVGWAYSQVSVFNHMYRDITIPANESKVTLSFKWKAGGEGGTTSDWDNMKVFLAPTTTVPTSTAAVTGATQLSGPGAVSGMYKLNSAAWNNETITFSGVPGTTYRLIFQWKSDGTDIVNPPAALDDISVVTSLPGIFISIITGNWNNPATWDANAVPSAADNATVSATHTVTVNAVGQAINNLIVNGTLAYSTTPAQFNVNGNLTVNATGLVNAFATTTGKTLVVSGNIVNDGRIDISVGTTTAGNLTLNGSTVQSVTGSGIWGGTVSATDATNRVGIIRNLTCSNTNTSTPNIIWSFNNIRIANNLNLTGARVNMGTNKMIFGNYAVAGTLTSPVTAGFLPGATFARWWTTAATGSVITAGTDPTNTTSRYPFLNTAGTSNRAMYITRTGLTTGNVAGELAVTYADATTMTTGLSVVDVAYTVTDRYDGNWTVTSGPGYFHAGAHTAVLLGQGAYPPLNGNSRVMLAGAAAGGTHQNGTTSPGAQRIGMSLADLTAGPLYMGIASADNQYPCAGTPLIPEALASTSASVCPNGTVTMAATGLTTGFIGITNQWQVSTISGGPYTNVVGGTGATTATHTTAAIPTPGTYYYVLASTCTNSAITSLSNEVIVTVNALPTVTATPTNSGNFCGVGSLTATGAVNYTWSPGSSLLSNTGATVTSIATANTTFTVTGTDANGCVNTGTASIIYTAPPAIAITASTASFCGTGGTSTLTAASAGAYTYAWTALDGATLSATTGNSTVATITQTSSVRVTGTESSSGCVEIQNYSIGVYPLPSATVTTSANGVCPGTSATINSGLSAGNFSVQCITHGWRTAPASAFVLCSNGVKNTPPAGQADFSLDDGKWGDVPIGFNFNYFGTTFTTCNVGTNGVMNFGPYASFNGAQYSFPNGFPSVNSPLNTIGVLATDFYMNTSGSVRYWTEGYAPNRIFVLEYLNGPGWTADGLHSVQCHLFETTGIVEIHVAQATGTGTFAGPKTIGLQNGAGTIGAIAPVCGSSPQTFWNARNATILSSSPQGWRFAPPSNYTTTWFANGTQFDSGTNIFSQSVSPLATTTYSISYTDQTTGCTNAAGSAQVTMAVLGTVAPTGVTASASSSSVCSGVTFNLTTDYTGLPDGLTYQWQVSTDAGANWTDITGATALTYNASLTAASWFRIGITSCGGTIAYSTPAVVALAPPTDCYCVPVYTSGTSFGDLISNVQIVGTTLANNTGFVAGGPSYTFFTGQPNYTATLLPSSSYTLQISTGEYGDQGYAAWIDYNDDGVFDASELVGATPTVIGSGLTTGVINASSSFTIALACTPPAGVHRMRVRGVYFQNGPTIDPCISYSFGETEDYLITIAPAPTCPAPGLMTVATTTTTSADLSWPLGCSSATNYDFEYGPAGFTQGTGTLIPNATATIVSTNGSYTLAGLTPNTPYSVYYRANCGAGDVSPWSVASNFTTLCAPITLNTVNPGVACDSYALVALSEATPSNNAGLTIGYYGNTGGTGGSVTGPITSTQTVYAYAFAGSCSTEQAVAITIYNTPQLTSLSPTICLGDSSVLWATQGTAIDFVYTLNGTFIGSGVGYYVSPATTTTYGISAVGVGGCISAEQLATVTVNQPTTSTSSATACDTYTWNNQTYTVSGSYTYTTANALGCDSIATLNLTINNSTTSTTTVTACDTYSWNAQTYTQSGTYTYQTTNAAGCDSTATLNLTINNSTTSSTPVIACVSYQWNGQTYTQSGTYTYVTPNAVGCDSTATLNLTINNALFTTENVSACITYDWNGQTYTQSGTYTYLATSVNGCDSTVTLNLTINQPNTSTTTQTACDSYTWNGQTYTQSGTYVFNTTTVAGCDSTATLNLTVNASSTSTSTATACGTYSWNGQTYTQSGAYTYTTQNAAGCDSVATLNLTINAIPNATATNNGDGTGTASAGSTYQWIDCATNTAIAGATTQTYAPVITGSYSVIVTNASGCADTSSCITIEVIGLDETKESLVQVQPNPSTGLFNILFGENANGTVVITDATGRIIGTEVVNGSTKAIDLTTAVTGIYYFTIQTDNIEKVIKVIKN
jgi:hypothetical protein